MTQTPGIQLVLKYSKTFFPSFPDKTGEKSTHSGLLFVHPPPSPPPLLIIIIIIFSLIIDKMFVSPSCRESS